MRTLSRLLLGISLAAGMAAIPIFAFCFDGAKRLAAARDALTETGEPIDLVGALIAPLNEVQEGPGVLEFASLDPRRVALRLEYDDGTVAVTKPVSCDGSLSFEPVTVLPHGAAWLTWVPVTSDPGLGPRMSGCGTCNRRGRLPIRAVRRPDGRVGVQVSITEQGLVLVGARWKVASADGLTP